MGHIVSAWWAVGGWTDIIAHITNVDASTLFHAAQYGFVKRAAQHLIVL